MDNENFDPLDPLNLPHLRVDMYGDEAEEFFTSVITQEENLILRELMTRMYPMPRALLQ